jgi:branched-chain amino acid transport system substrate-binding protein
MKTSTRFTLVVAAAALATPLALAQGAKLEVCLMLPATGTFAALGAAIENGFKLYVAEQGGKLGGREIECGKVDDESEPAKATDNINKLIKRDNDDVVVGTVHSGVAMAMARVAKESGTLLIVPNAGAGAVTGPTCAPNIFRSSFSNWQTGYATGEAVTKKGPKKVATITWKYVAGDEMVAGFKEAFEKAGGQVVKELNLPFPNVEFQARLTDIAATKPDGGTLEVQGADAEGISTALHCADLLDTPKDNAFRLAYATAYKLQPDAYAVQGYDAAQMPAVGLAATKGDAKKTAEFAKAVQAARIDSPRGMFTVSKSNNPVQDFSLRQVVGKENKNVGLASKALADPVRGCKA